MDDTYIRSLETAIENNWEEQLETLLSTVAECTDVTALQEYTLESGRPDTITAEKLSVLRDGGVGRISVNPQNLSDDVLRSIGRHHTDRKRMA